MTRPAELHLDRERAESFGAVAEQYDRYRPGYPAALIDDLVVLRPGRVLDVGCGTGKAAVALAERGLAVLGIDPDERMATVARGHGLTVEVAAFEGWDPAGRRFGLVTCGDAWHWIDGALGSAKAAEAVAVGGTLARFWTSSWLGAPVVDALDEVYGRLAPEVAQVWRPESSALSHARAADPVASSRAFAPPERRTYPSERRLTTEEWVGLAATISDHRRLGAQRLALLLSALRTTVDDLGGSLLVHSETLALLSRRV